MATPPCTCRAVAVVRLPAEPRYWTDNLPPGHGRYTLIYLWFYGAQMHPDRYCWYLDSNNGTWIDILNLR